jgi:ATP-dependent Lhr-like helicase
VATRRTLSSDDVRDLAALDPAAIAQVRREAWPLVRSADELHDALLSLVAIDAVEAAPWAAWLEDLIRAGRATRIARPEQDDLWTAAEHWPIVEAAYPDAQPDPPVELPPRLQKRVEPHAAVTTLVRGRIEHAGPTTVERIAQFLAQPLGQVEASLEALEGQGLVLRGNFIQSERAVDAGGNASQWCDRRLLARIHRLTLDGLRRQIRPVEPRVYLAFLLGHHRLHGDGGWGGPVGVREAISQLQGFEMPAGAWEARILAARTAGYDPAWLDNLFLSGEVVWGRLNRPQRGEDAGPSTAAMSRVVPISLVLREDLPLLLGRNEKDSPPRLRSGAQQVLDALSRRGALFFNELSTATGLLPAHLEEALRELAALGMITSDAFAAVRRITGEERRRSRRGSRRLLHAVAAPVGRWSLFPGAIKPADDQEHLQRWCRLLLARWGVVFRDLLVRETSAPSWPRLVRVFRRMELGGEVRGGRFVSGVSGEQYALPDVIEQLRRTRDEADQQPWTVISAADPLNLYGIITGEPRIPATHRNALIVQGGRLLAARQAGVPTFFTEVDEATQWAMRRAMTVGKRPTDKTRQAETDHRRPDAVDPTVV